MPSTPDPFTEEERIAGLLEIIDDEDMPAGIEQQADTRVVELCTYKDEGGLWALTPLTVSLRVAPNTYQLHRECTVVWRADVDGLHAQCTLLDVEGIVIARWEAHGNA